jgi:hypothetical protein
MASKRAQRRIPRSWRPLLVGGVAAAGLLAAQGAAATRALGYVYWTEIGSMAIARAASDGSEVNKSFISGLSNPYAIAVGAGHVYWGDPYDGNIGRADLDGSHVEPTFITSSDKRTDGIALDGAHIYWTDEETDTIGRADIDGSNVEPSFITGTKQAEGIAVDSSYIYWANASGNTIGRADLSGGGVTEDLISTEGDIGLALDSSHLYWSDYWTGYIGRANLDGSEAQDTFIDTGEKPQRVAVDGAHVYWTNEFKGGGGAGTSIGRANLAGGEVQDDFISGLNTPFDLATDTAVAELRPTAMALSCAKTATNTYSCTATVSDHGRAPAVTPTGAVSFVSGGGSFPAGNSCTLTPAANAGEASCSVTLLTGTAVTVTADYSGGGGEGPTSASTSAGEGPPPPRPTSAEIVCDYTVSTSTDDCLATVIDIGAGTRKAPTGMLAFASGSGGAFPAGTHCLLTPEPLYEGVSSCSVQFIPKDFPTVFPNLTVVYGGDAVHGGCTANTVFGRAVGTPEAQPDTSSVTVPAGSEGQLPTQVDVQTNVPAAGSTVEADVALGGQLGGELGPLPKGSRAAALGGEVPAAIDALVHWVERMRQAGGTSAEAVGGLTGALGNFYGDLYTAVDRRTLGTIASALLGTPLGGSMGGVAGQLGGAGPVGGLTYMIGPESGFPSQPPVPGESGTVAYVVAGQATTEEAKTLTVLADGEMALRIPSDELASGGEAALAAIATSLEEIKREATAVGSSHSVRLDSAQVQEISEQLRAMEATTAAMRAVEQALRSVVNNIGKGSVFSGSHALAARARHDKRRRAHPLGVAIARSARAGKLTLRVRLDRATMRRLSRHHRKLQVYVRVTSILPSRVLPRGYPVATIERVTLHAGALHKRRRSRGHRHRQ